MTMRIYPCYWSVGQSQIKVNRALELGWPPERIVAIDEDQGKSGASAENQLGFGVPIATEKKTTIFTLTGVQ